MIWGSLPGCHPVHQRFATLLPGALGEAINPCTILYNRRQRWPWGKLCTVTIHATLVNVECARIPRGDLTVDEVTPAT